MTKERTLESNSVIWTWKHCWLCCLPALALSSLLPESGLLCTCLFGKLGMSAGWWHADFWGWKGGEQDTSDRDGGKSEKVRAYMAQKQCGCLIGPLCMGGPWMWCGPRTLITSGLRRWSHWMVWHCPSHPANKKSLCLKWGSPSLHYWVMLLIWCLRSGHSEFQLVARISRVQ